MNNKLFDAPSTWYLLGFVSLRNIPGAFWSAFSGLLSCFYFGPYALVVPAFYIVLWFAIPVNRFVLSFKIQGDIVKIKFINFFPFTKEAIIEINRIDMAYYYGNTYSLFDCQIKLTCKEMIFAIYIPLQFKTKDPTMIAYINTIIRYKENRFPYKENIDHFNVAELVKKTFPDFPLKLD